MHHRMAERQQKNTQWRKGIKQQVFAQPQEGIDADTRGSPVRRLLCDDADCEVCEHAAQEALEFIYSWGTKQERLKDSRSQEPPVSCTKYPAPPCGFLVRGPDSVLRSASEPAPLFDHALPDQKTPALSSSPSLPKDDEGRATSTPHHVPYAWKEDSNLSVTQDILKEDSFGSISFTYSTTSSCSNSSFSFSEISSSSLKVHVSAKHVKKYRSKVHHESYKDSPRISSGKALTGRQRKKRSGRKTPSMPGLAETSKTDSAGFRGMSISFIDKTTLASLESHMVTKRMQHLIGLPLALLRSLKKFIPSAPHSPTQRHKRKVTVAPRPQVLSFIATGIRKELERHLKKMVQQKRWQLPQRVQDALKRIKTYSPSLRPEKFSSAGWRHKHKDIGQIKSARRLGKPTAKQSAPVEVLNSKTTPALQEKLQVHITKKSLEMKLETFHSIVRLSQKISRARARHWLLPKLIPLGQIHHQLRNKVGLSLRKKADTVEMNVKSKCIYFLWGLPTLYMKSLSRFVPSPPSQPMSFTVVHPLIEFGLTTPALMISSDGKNLETHVLKKRLQHQWGLPRLVLRSLREFLLPTPPSQVHLRTKSYDQCEVQIFIGFTQLLFTTSEVRQKLETHLRSKIIERQWGLPKRVFESLQMFFPPASTLTRRPTVDGKSFAREFKMGIPSTAMISYRRKPVLSLEKHQSVQRSKGQVLQRKLAKKVLESHLSPIVPTAHQPWRGTNQRVVHKLPPPQTCSLQPRSQQLLFVDQEALSHIKLNIIHKDLTYKWKMSTIFSKSLTLLFQNITPSAFIHHPSRKSAGFSFTEKDTPFVVPKAREALEWHVRKKTLHHIWGLPRLIWRSVQYLLPATPSAHPQKKLHREAIIFPSEVSFLSNTIKRELERNVQKRVVCQRWLLPKRVLESMKLFYSSYSYLKPIIPWQEQGSRLSKIEIAAPPPQFHARIQVEVHLKLQLHLAKKHLEMYLEAPPVMVRTSWRHMVFSLRTPLPKIISSHQPLLPRRTLLPFACGKAMDRIEMTVQRNHFASLWELSTHYVKALEQLMPKPSSRPLRSQKMTAFQFTKIQWVLPPGFSVETLELHVKRKRIQHEWGVPVLIQKSLKSFLYQPPSRSSLTKTKISVHNLAQDLMFLPQDICKNLELHVQKTKLYHQWGLPQRVLGSLKKLQPEVKIHAPRPKTLVHHRRTVSTYKTIPLFQTKSILCTVCYKQRMVAIPPHVPHKLSLRGSNHLEKISLHLSKKYVEIQLEVFPDVVMGSWKLNVLVTRQPLPKLISHSPKTFQPRRSFLPFVQKQEAKRLEMAVQLCYFSSLCGLGNRYVEAVDAMIPRSYAPPFQRKKVPSGMFSETQIPFLQQQQREFIELHIRKKRLHHEWGFPALIQSSLRVFMQGFPSSSTTHRTTIKVDALPQKLSFLPWPTCNYLEFHVQKLKLQRRWGLPKRILESLKYFRPSAPLGKAQLPPSDKKTKLTEARLSAGGSQRACCKLVEFMHHAPKKLDLLKEHIRRKYLQRQLETLPRLVRQSHKDSSTMPQKHLPKLIEAGQKSPTHRAQSLLFLPPSDINRLEQNVRHKRLMFLWGISKKYMESLSVVVPLRPFPGRTRKASIAIQPLKTPFVQKEAREVLEYHIQKKRLHHFWGLPSIIQSSLQAFTTYLPIDPHPPLRIRQEIRISGQDLPFVSERVQQNLASSIKKMVIHSQWGLPKRLQKFLHGFHPTPPGELREFRNFLVSGPKFKRAQRITRLPEASFIDGQPKKTPFLTNESADLLERHIQHKKFQHEWGLPSVLQRSLRAFAPLPPEPRRASTRLAIAAPSSLQTEGRLMMTPKLLFLDPVTKEHLEAHTKRRIARHKWGLPKQVQESMKTLLPPTYFRQPEDLIDRIPLGTHDQVYPARIKEISDTRDQHLPTIRKARKRKSQIEDYGGRQLPLTAGGHPKSPSPRVMSRTPTPSGKVTPKFNQESWAATFYTKEVWDSLEFHIRHKRIQHDWGLPSMVKKSLNAFAPHPPELQSTTARAGGRLSMKSQGKRAMHRSLAMEQATILRSDLHFLSTEVNDHLEAHLKNWTVQHKWGLLKRIHGSLRTITPPRPESQAGMHQPHGQHSRSAQPHKIFSHRERETSQWQVTSKKGASKVSNTIRHQGQSSAWAKLMFLTEDSWNLLEFHIQQKKIQHGWGVPSMVLRSLNAFFPFPIKIQSPGKKRLRANQGVTEDIKVFVPSMFFLSRETKEVLEVHMKKKIAEHKWSVPKRLQQTLGTLSTPRSRFQSKDFYRQAPLCRRCQLLLQTTDDSQTEKEEEDGDLLEESEKDRRRKRRKKEYFHPRNQRRSTSSGRANKQLLLFSELRLPFLSDEARNYLEFHIQQKKIQRAWSLPSTVLRSLHAFAPFPPEIERRIQSIRKRIVKTHGWKKTEVAVIVPDLSFLSKRTKDILEAHLKRRTAEHRWGMPKTIQKLLGLLVPSRPPSQHESVHEQPSLCWKCKSLLGYADVSQTEEESDDMGQDIKKDKRRKRWKGKDFQPRKQMESTHGSPDGRRFLAPMEGRLSFLSDGARNYLEFHIQQKKIQRAWNLPSLVLKSLRAFAPFPLEEQKDMQDPRDRKTKNILWEKRDVPINVQSPFFLSPDVEEHLDTHVRHITTKHQWGLLERVQQPLQAFLPLRSHSPSELEEGKEGSLEGSKPGKVYRKANVMPFAKGHLETTPFFYSEVKLPFFEETAWNLLEFHIQHKKLQHAWGLPFTVLKSLDAFAPYLRDSTKRPLALQGAVTARKLPLDREFRMIAQNLSFLSSDTKQHLEAHLRNLVAVHRWGLPKHAQTTLRAFLHPGTLSSPAQSRGYKSPQISLPQTWVTDRSPMKKFQLRKKEVPITSSTVYFRSRKVDFLDDGAQNLLEFHILHKKIQHTWGLPAIIQKSLRLFAPSESQKKPQSAGDVTMKTAVSVAAPKSWIAKEVTVAPQQLGFLHPDIKKQLESHIRDVTVKHRWRLPKLVQDTLVAFIPQTEETGEEMKEPFSTYDEDLLKSSSSLGVPDVYDSELFYELHQTPVEIRASWLDTEEPSFCFDRKIQHDRTIQGKMARREAPEVRKQHKSPLERTESDFYLKDEQRWASDLLGSTRDPRGPFFSTPVSGYRKCKYNVSSSSESLSMEKYPSQRTDWLAREREALPCSSNLSLKKDLLKQLQSTSQRKEDDRYYYPVGLKQSQLSKDSSSSWVPNRLCKIDHCPCLCHLPSSREGSMFSLQSVRKQEQRPDLIWGMVKETETDSSSLLTEDRSSLPSISAKKAEVRFSSLTSEDAVSESSSVPTLRTTSLPEQETTPSSTGDQGALSQEERVFASNTDLQKVTTSGSERPSGSSEQLSSSPKGTFFQEAVQPSLAVEQTSVMDYRREGEQTVTELGMDEPDGGKHSTTEKVGEKTLNLGTDLSTKEPFTDSRPFIERKSTKMPGSTQKRREPMSERGQSTKPKKQVRHAQFLVSVEPEEKMSILGRILERKLRLRHGLNIWRYSRGKSQVVSRIKHKIDSFRQSFRVRSRTRSKDSARRHQSHSPENNARSSSSGGKARSRGRSRERRSKTEVRRKELPQKGL